jgi:hypothetical protein
MSNRQLKNKEKKLKKYNLGAVTISLPQKIESI